MIRTLFTLFVVCTAGAAQATCREDVVELVGEFGQARFTVDLADEPEERSRGLMHVPSMPSGQGMLFIYDPPQRAVFWMKNTLIPLDMIFADVTGTITHIHENAIPMDETNIDGGPGVFAVLEINGGLSEAIGISVGDAMKHPSFNSEVAALPCE